MFSSSQDLPGAPRLVLGVPYKESIRGQEGEHLQEEKGPAFKKKAHLDCVAQRLGLGLLP